MSKVEGAISTSEMTFSAVQKMCYFQFINLFFASILAGSIFNRLSHALSHLY